MNEFAERQVGHHHDHFNPVQVHEAVGTMFLGLIALILLFAFLRQVKVNQRLITRLAALESS